MASWFMAPLFLAGVLLVGVPYLIHKIRRPERKEVKFSSLMFVPDLKIETIERRRIEHILLMLLRMLLVLILVFAFSRPFLERALDHIYAEPLPAGHIILLDTSYSMGHAGVFEAAKEKVTQILNNLPADVPVGLVSFSQQPLTLAPLIKPDGRPGTIAEAKRALAEARVTNEGTRYTAALQYAESRLLDAVGDDVDRPYTLHLVSDFQAQGLPQDNQDWTLSGQIAFEGHPVNPLNTNNLAVADVAVKTNAESDTLITAKVRNWSSTERGVVIRLFLDQAQVESQTLVVPARSAVPAYFRLPQGGASALWGRLEIDHDDLQLDNTRYFSVRPPEQAQLTLIEDHVETGSAGWFLRRGLQSMFGDQTLTTLDQNALAALPSADHLKADVLVVGDLKQFQPQTGKRLKAWLAKGGRILFTMGMDLDTAAVNQHLLAELGIETSGPVYADGVSTRYDTWTSMDFQHPVFRPFQGSQFNDFSRIRFQNHHRLSVNADSNRVQIPVRFSGPNTPPAPAVLELEQGRGRMLIWAFATDPKWTNLPKSVKFPPILDESIQFLRGYQAGQTAYRVGVPSAGPSVTRAGNWTVTMPNQQDLNPELDVPPILSLSPGLVTFQETDGRKRTLYEAVNIESDESSSERITAAEFASRFTTAKPSADTATAATAQRPDEKDRRIEFGRGLLILAIILVLIETIYATRLVTQKATAKTS